MHCSPSDGFMSFRWRIFLHFQDLFMSVVFIGWLHIALRLQNYRGIADVRSTILEIMKGTE